MLLALRDRLSGYLAWIIAILITIPFALWGVQEYMGLGQSAYAVKVNDEKISMNDYDTAVANARMNLLQSFGGRIPPGFNAEEYLRKQTLEQLIRRELLTQLFERSNYRIEGTELQQKIMRDPRFQIESVFNKEKYRAELSSRGISAQQYEESLRREFMLMQLELGLRQTALAPADEMAEYARMAYQTRDFDYVLLPRTRYEKDLNVTDREIADYYAGHADLFMTDELVRVEYVEFSLDEMAKEVKVTDDILRELYQSSVDAGLYQTEEVRDASHILIRVPDDASEAVIAEKKAKAESILQSLRRGEKFAEIAKKESEDPGSAAQGGSLGEVRRGVMVKPFEDTLFTLSQGELSEPVLTRFGFHIIKVNAIQPPKVESFENVKSAIEQNYRKEQTDSAFYDRVDRLQTLSFENPDDLSLVAEQIGVELRESGFFPKAGTTEGIAANPEVIDAAFSKRVLLDRENSGLIEIDENHVVVLKVKEHKASRPETLDEARAEIRDVVRNEKADAAVAAAANEIMTAIAQGGNLQTIAERHSAEYKLAAEVKRDSQNFPEEIQQAAFKMPAPDGQPSLKKVRLTNGDYAVLRLMKVEPGDIARLDEKEREQLHQQIEQGRGSYELEAMFAAMKEAADIWIHPDLQ